jgi:hypothetical protein
MRLAQRLFATSGQQPQDGLELRKVTLLRHAVRFVEHKKSHVLQFKQIWRRRLQASVNTKWKKSWPYGR